jgi:hypothetical protein
MNHLFKFYFSLKDYKYKWENMSYIKVSNFLIQEYFNFL